MPKLSFTSAYPVPRSDLFNWHTRVGAIDRLTPPWVKTVVERWDGIRDGDRAVIRMSMGPVTQRWVAVHRDLVNGERFADYQESGPFKSWGHEHIFTSIDDRNSRLTDDIEYELKGGPIADKFLGKFATGEIERAFEYRHRVLGQDLLLHQQYNLSNVRLKIGISGSTGLIGSEIAAFFSAGGHEVIRIVRDRKGSRDHAYWDPQTGEIEKKKLEGLDVIIHLAGESVAGWRWDSEKKQRIRESRLRGTHLLSKTVASLSNPPTAFLVASGIGVYGSHGETAATEASALRSGGFLSSVAKEWEASAEPAVKSGVRTVFLRLGAVLSPRGGMLKQILPLFRSGLGGRFTGDEQWISWITIDDVIGSIYHVMMSSTAGPVNIVTPTPITMESFARTLGSVLRRPAWIVAPRGVARSVFGEVADEVLMASQRVQPAYLKTSGYQFLYPQLEGALRHLLGKKPPYTLNLDVIRR